MELSDHRRSILLLLEKSGYRRTELPIRIATVVFEFDAVLTGPGDRAELVLLASSVGENVSLLKRRIRALVIALDRIHARRPLTLIAISSEWSDTDRDELREMCRVFLLRSGDSPDSVAEELRILLPIEIPPPIASDGIARVAIAQRIEDGDPAQLKKRLLGAADKSADDVKRVFLQAVELALASTTEGQ